MPTAKTSLTLDKTLLKAARELVGRRGLSRYVNRALRHELQRDRLAGLLDELAKEAGAVDARVLEEVRSSWPDPAKAEPHSAWSSTPGRRRGPRAFGGSPS